MKRIQNYFNLLAQRIAIGSGIAGSSSHKPDSGLNREQLVKEFLERHLPRRLSVSIGGQIIGYDGSESNQIDIIVSNDIAVRFEENERTFVIIEGVASAITVKSYLNKSAIKDCLLNLASIPQADRKVIKFNTMQSDTFIKFIESHPSLYVYAFKGIKLQTCINHLYEFYQNHEEIPANRYPTAIIVNKEYYITFTGENKQPRAMRLEQDMWGYPFISILGKISTYTSWLPSMIIKIHLYFHKTFLSTND